jgi:MFS family permease
VISSVGQFFGGFACGWTSDRIGRKKSLAIGVVIVTGGIFGETFSTTRAAFVVSKCILGVGVGFYLTLGPITCSEIAPTILRGISTAGVSLGIAVGQLLSNAATSSFGNRDDVWSFRGPFLIQLFFSVFLFIGSFLSPGSPWYLARSGQLDAARATLMRLYGSEAEAEEKLTGILLTLGEEAQLPEASYKSASPELTGFVPGSPLEYLLASMPSVSSSFSASRPTSSSLQVSTHKGRLTSGLALRLAVLREISAPGSSSTASVVALFLSVG